MSVFVSLNCRFLRREVTQRERRKRARTINEPNKIPMTTHKRRPKIDVGFDSSVLTNAPSYTDIIVLENKKRRNGLLLDLLGMVMELSFLARLHLVSPEKKRFPAIMIDEGANQR